MILVWQCILSNIMKNRGWRKKLSRKKIVTILVIIIVIIGIIGFIVWKNLNKSNKQNDNTIKIVTSFYPMYILAENITDGATNIELENMADVNVGCLHDYTLTTEDMKKLENADIFISNGLGMENFIDKAISANQAMKIIDSSTNIQDLILHEDETNAHIWTSIEKYIEQVKNVSEGLKESNPENAEIYEENANNYIEKLEQLREKYLNELKNLQGKKAICLNEAFEYMGQELGLEMTTVKTDHEESTMSAEMLKSIIDTAKEENIEMIIVDKNDNRANAETIEQETGARIYELNSGLSGSMEKDEYVKAIEENLQLLK